MKRDYLEPKILVIFKLEDVVCTSTVKDIYDDNTWQDDNIKS